METTNAAGETVPAIVLRMKNKDWLNLIHLILDQMSIQQDEIEIEIRSNQCVEQ